ncbi:MAG: UDP-N-acetylmuramoyl-tripeptide--D-alanyl-D-alanine ligase [Candidatus Abawacabacteria bacterium]|nr:UDP-N-acetylmuramoyl-tripeptide--D-alanyl-D-alanine ligase [Candidatus Abawacabacteria bacterium]
MKKLIQNYIIWCAKRKIKNTTAKIIAITGSVGKSTTKEAIAQVLGRTFKVRANYGSLNNELGLPLAILGEKSAVNLLQWLGKVLRISFRTFIYDSSIEFYVLECGIDKPGDMDEILTIIKPDISVITTVESVHTQNFGGFEELVKEKWKLAHGTKSGGIVIANYDNPPTHDQAKNIQDKTLITFGLNERASFYATNIEYDLQGTNFAVIHNHEPHSLHLALLGKAPVYSSLPAIIIGKLQNLSWEDIASQLSTLKPLPGRLSAIPGIKGSILLEGSYNASPASMKMSLEILRNLPAKRRIAIVGDMRELGDITQEAHVDMLSCLGNVCDLVIAFGPYYAEALAHQPKHNRNQASFKHFLTREEIVDFITPKLSEGDIVLVKGSQNTIMLEKVSEQLMADPSKAKDLLPRQYGKWKRI